MSITARVVTTSTSAALVESGVPEGKVVIIRGASADTIFLGGSDVTSAAGLPLLTTDVLSMTLYQGDELYAIASAATPSFRILVTRDNT